MLLEHNGRTARSVQIKANSPGHSHARLGLTYSPKYFERLDAPVRVPSDLTVSYGGAGLRGAKLWDSDVQDCSVQPPTSLGS